MILRGKEKKPVVGGQKSSKAVTSAVAVTDELLAKINRYTLEPLTAEDVFIGKQLLAHNGIDRDRERFTSQIIDNFVDTLPGKSTLYFHDSHYLPLGLYFDAKAEEISADRFKELTGEPIKLPDGVDQAYTLWAWYYVVKTPDVEFVLKNIKGGTFRHWSIRFNAASIVSIKEDPNGPIKYWEYVGPAEALEGSLVWLGAQPGATSQKAAGNDPDHQSKEEMNMKNLLLKLGVILGKSFADDTTEEQAAKAVEEAMKAKDDKISELSDQVEALKSTAELGKKFVDSTAAEYTRMKVLLGECEETEESKKMMNDFGKSMGIDFLQMEVKSLEKRVAEKFPDGQLRGSDGGNTGASGDKNPLVVE